MTTIRKLIRWIRTSTWNRRRVLRRIERAIAGVECAELDRASLAATYLGQARQDVSWQIAQQARRRARQ